MIVNAYQCCMLIASHSVTGSTPRQVIAYSVSCAPPSPFLHLPTTKKKHLQTPFSNQLLSTLVCFPWSFLNQLTIQQGQGDTSKATRSERQAAETHPFRTGGATHPQHLSVHRHIHRMPQGGQGPGGPRFG